MRLLFLTSRVPYPIEKGDKLRVFNFIKEMSKYHEVYLFAIDESNTSDENIQVLKQYCKSVEIFPISKFDIACNIVTGIFKGLPLQVAFYTNKAGIKAFNNFCKDIHPDHIFCQLLRVTEYVKDICYPNKTIDIQDTMSVNIARSNKKRSFIVRPIFNLEEKRLKKYEYELFNLYNNKIIITESDRILYPHPRREEIHIVPNGVDYEYFTHDTEVNKDIDLVFTGNMGYKPNIDAAFYLIEKILPIVYKVIPDIKVAIVGTNPPKSLVNKANKNIEVTGWVKSVKDYYSRAKVFIAPMRIGTGLQNKLLEAMAMNLPCITTPLANNSLKATDKTEILIGNDEVQLADSIINLLKDNTLNDTIAKNGNLFVRSTYNWQTVGEQINRIITT